MFALYTCKSNGSRHVVARPPEGWSKFAKNENIIHTRSLAPMFIRAHTHAHTHAYTPTRAHSYTHISRYKNTHILICVIYIYIYIYFYNKPNKDIKVCVCGYVARARYSYQNVDSRFTTSFAGGSLFGYFVGRPSAIRRQVRRKNTRDEI